MCEKNNMGSEIIKGFKCKPVDFDKDKPVMYCAIQIFICDDERCKLTRSVDIAKKIRKIVKSLGFDKGNKRIKVTRTFCNGACRFRNFAYIYKNPNNENYSPELAYTAWKNIQEWSDKQWEEMILGLMQNQIPEELKDYTVQQKVFDETEKIKH